MGKAGCFVLPSGFSYRQRFFWFSNPKNMVFEPKKAKHSLSFTRKEELGTFMVNKLKNDE
jgi:hypothetical protein